MMCINNKQNQQYQCFLSIFQFYCLPSRNHQLLIFSFYILNLSVLNVKRIDPVTPHIIQMQPRISQLEPEPSPAALDLLQVDQSIIKIEGLNTNKIQSLSEISRRRISKRFSAEYETANFEQKLSLDMIIEKLLQNLIRTKIELMQLEDQGLIKETERTKNFISYFKQQVHKYHKTLLLRESQLGSLVYVIQNAHNPDFRQKYLASYGFLDKFIINADQAKKPINTVILEEAFEAENQFLQEYVDMIALVKLNIVHKKYFSDMQPLIRASNRLKIINSKIASIAEMFPFACVVDKHDLFSYKKTSERWHHLLENSIRYKIYGSKDAISKSFANLKSGLNFVNATMSIMHQTRQSWGTAKDIRKDLASLAESTSKILKCLIFKQHAHHEAEMLISDPNSELAKQIWNLPEQKMFRNLINSVLPSIAFSQQFWIPRLFTQFLQMQGNIDLPEVAIQNMQDYSKNLFSGADKQNRIQMRINSPFVLRPREGKRQQIKLKSILGVLVKSFISAKSLDFPTAVIFHIHGGGFISMSSFIHQTYTRIWANNLNVPIISVDYGKAPQFPFPNGLHDCFEAYMWTLYCYRQIFDAEPLTIILVGDSAGGNLVAALTNMLIKLKLRAPDGIVLIYPALNLSQNSYTPSLLTSLNDLILPHTFLKICLKAYLKEGVNQNDEYVSPIYAPEETLKKYPPTRIFVGSKDPFHDDCCRFTEKLNKYDQNKAKLVIFDQFPHGFLQFDMKTQPHEECRKATKQVQNAIGELLALNQ